MDSKKNRKPEVLVKRKSWAEKSAAKVRKNETDNAKAAVGTKSLSSFFVAGDPKEQNSNLTSAAGTTKPTAARGSTAGHAKRPRLENRGTITSAAKRLSEATTQLADEDAMVEDDNAGVNNIGGGIGGGSGTIVGQTIVEDDNAGVNNIGGGIGGGSGTIVGQTIGRGLIGKKVSAKKKLSQYQQEDSDSDPDSEEEEDDAMDEDVRGHSVSEPELLSNNKPNKILKPKKLLISNVVLTRTVPNNPTSSFGLKVDKSNPEDHVVVTKVPSDRPRRVWKGDLIAPSIKLGDIIVAVNGNVVFDTKKMKSKSGCDFKKVVKLMRSTRPGESLRLDLLRLEDQRDSDEEEEDTNTGGASIGGGSSGGSGTLVNIGRGLIGKKVSAQKRVGQHQQEDSDSDSEEEEDANTGGASIGGGSSGGSGTLVNIGRGLIGKKVSAQKRVGQHQQEDSDSDSEEEEDANTGGASIAQKQVGQHQDLLDSDSGEEEEDGGEEDLSTDETEIVEGKYHESTTRKCNVCNDSKAFLLCWLPVQMKCIDYCEDCVSRIDPNDPSIQYLDYDEDQSIAPTFVPYFSSSKRSERKHSAVKRIDGSAGDHSAYINLSGLPITKDLGERLDTKEVAKVKTILTSKDGMKSNDLATLAVAIRDSMERTGDDVDDDFGDDMMGGELYGGILGAASSSLRQKLLNRDDPLFPLFHKWPSCVVPGRINATLGSAMPFKRYTKMKTADDIINLFQAATDEKSQNQADLMAIDSFAQLNSLIHVARNVPDNWKYKQDRKKKNASKKRYKERVGDERAQRIVAEEIAHEHRVTDLLFEVWEKITPEVLDEIPSDVYSKPQPGWKDGVSYYLVSNCGRVKARYFVRTADNLRGEWREALLEGIKDEKGYIRYGLKDQSRGETVHRMFFSHRLVAAAFLAQQKADKIEEVGKGTELTVDHIDRDRGNNDVDNLRWATHSEQNTNRELNEGLPGIRYYQKEVKSPIDLQDVYIHPDFNDIGALEDGTIVVKDSGTWKVKETLTQAQNYVYFSHHSKKFRRNRFAMDCYRHAEQLPKLTKDQIVDHISGVRSNDSKDNLRVFTDDPDGPSATMKNGRNRAELNSNNASGIRGVSRFSKNGTWYWRAYINDDIGHSKNRYFREDDGGKEKAIAKRKEWVDKYGYYNC